MMVVRLCTALPSKKYAQNKTNDLAAFETVKIHGTKCFKQTVNMLQTIEAEITHKKAKKEEADKLNTVVHVWSKIMSQAQWHLKATYSPNKALEYSTHRKPTTKRIGKETAALNTIHQHLQKAHGIEKLKKGIEELLASKDEKKFAKLAD
uniref:Uncharacterized protein n=1 Tax=Ditylenchus dipsaci TaxID=166011 RepID=A0A915CQD9_9BILA